MAVGARELAQRNGSRHCRRARRRAGHTDSAGEPVADIVPHGGRTRWLSDPDWTFTRAAGMGRAVRIPRLTGWLILKLNDGTWIGGLWGKSASSGQRSYAAGYPESQDLLVADLAEVDADGDMLVGTDSAPIFTGISLLVRWDEVAYARFTPA